MSERLWFITGAGRGLGRAFTEAALAQGDRVVATVRRHGALHDVTSHRLHVRHLDVTSRAEVFGVASAVVADIGVPDVVVNNAGYGQVGAVEELTENAVRAQLDTNTLGPLWVSQAFAPHLRARGTGHIVQVSTVGAVGHLTLFGAYNASKWALEGWSGALADELRPFGVHVHLLQLGGFATDWAGSSLQFAEPLPAYDGMRDALFGSGGDEAGYPPDDDPRIAARALLELVEQPDPPLRSVIGTGARDMVTAALAMRRDDYARDPGFAWPA